MGIFNCSACEDLRETDPNLLINGIGENECASLQNNTGLSPSDDNDDFTDLSNMNDCLIGNMASEVDSFDNCAWKQFAKRIIPNIWTTFKGVICAIGGLWQRTDALCTLISMQMNPSLTRFGVLPRNTIEHNLGTIPTKNGQPIMKDEQLTTHNADIYTCVGIRYASKIVEDCVTGQTRMYEWLMPCIWGYALSEDASIGDAVWYATKTELQEAGAMSDFLWQIYTDESWTWTTFPITTGNAKHKYAWFRLHVGDDGMSDDYLVLTFQGTSYPNAAPGYDARITEPSTNEARNAWHWI